MKRTSLKEILDIMKKNFTFIELLIVIAIIGILVTLLLPSLQNARHQARMTVCLSNLSQIGKGLFAGSQNNNRKWLERKVIPGASFVFNYKQGSRFNHINIYKDYIDGSLMGCPVGNNNVKWEDSEYYNFRSYSIFAGWQYKYSSSYMKFVGRESLIYGGNEFDVLVGDTYFYRNNRQLLSHPDNEGQFGIEHHWDDAIDSTNWWGSNQTLNANLPPADMNYCFSDGSAKTFKNVSPQKSSFGTVPDKFENNTGFGGWRGNILLPFKN
jgi:prepilin-type N-terminal cleavage/methylation domain-containing protein